MSRRTWGAWNSHQSIDKAVKTVQDLIVKEAPRSPTSSGLLDVKEVSALQFLVSYAISCRRSEP